MVFLPSVLAARLRKIGFMPAKVEPPAPHPAKNLRNLFCVKVSETFLPVPRGTKVSGNVLTVPEGESTPPGRIMIFEKKINPNEPGAKLLESITPHLEDYCARYNLAVNEIHTLLTKNENFWLLQVSAAAGPRI